jgi:hypothetical protein
VVYTREAHPDQSPTPEARSAKTIAERRKAALSFSRREGLTMPILLDSMDDRGFRAVATQGSTIVVIDASGKFVYRSGAGYSLDPEKVVAAIERYTRPTL